MTKFNKQTGTAAKAAGVVAKTTNFEGAPAYTLSRELDLYSAVVTSTLSKTFYESEDGRVARIRDLVSKCNPEFVAKLAVYTREQMYLRTIPLILLVELARKHSGTSLVSKATARVVKRTDEITELLSYYALANERQGQKKLNRLSKQIVKGLEVAFNSFDEYQFSKYDRDGDITLKDALSVICPKAKDADQQKIFDKIMKVELETAYTWETELSALGQQKFETTEAKKAAVTAKWEELIRSGKVGYMALLRNLRNILEAGVSREAIGLVCSDLANEGKVRRSMQLPFRFLSAYRILTREKPSRDYYSTRTSLKKIPESFDTGEVLEALELAIKASVANIPGFGPETRILIADDTSASMRDPISEKSPIMRTEVGLVLSQCLASKCKSVMTGIFGESFKIAKLPKDRILENSSKLASLVGSVGHSTNGYLAVDYLTDNKMVADKVIMFTDCQLWDSNSDVRYRKGYRTLAGSWRDYKKIAPDAKLYIFDLAGYGTTPISTLEKDVYFIAGWSDRVFAVLEGLERGQSALEQIKTIEL